MPRQATSKASSVRPRIRDFFYLSGQLFLRDFRARYRRAYFALLWILAPLAVLTASAALIARELVPSLMTGPVPYPIQVVSGLMLWGVFADSVVGPVQMCRRSRSFLRRAPLEPGVILVTALGYVALNLAIRLPVLAGVMAWFSFAPPIQAALAIPLAGALCLLGLTLGALVAPLSLVYLDIRYGLPFALMIGLLLTPVFYPVPEAGLLRTIAEANPIAHLLVAARDFLTTGRSSFSWLAAGSAAVTILVAAPLSYLYYRWGLPKGIAHI